MPEDGVTRHRLTVTGLGCIRADRIVFRKLDLAVASGETLRVTGPNGSGKSSLLRLLAGLGRPAAGEIAWDGESVAADPPAYRARMLHLGHLDPIKPWMSVREHVRFWAGLAGADADPHAAPDLALGRLGLAGLAELPARFLSSGQRRRLALARLAAVPAPLWLLDEPTVGLDAESIGLVEALIADHCTHGGMALVATHAPIALPNAADLDLRAFTMTAAA